MKHDVFISYSSLDKQIADAVCSILENSKIRCWIAPRDILPGDTYGRAIIEAINDCKILIIIFSSNADSSGQVINEIERAVSKGKIIIPFRIENIKPSGDLELFLGRRHWLDAITPPVESHILNLSNTIHRLLNATKSKQEPLVTDKETKPVPNTNISWLMKTTKGPGQRSDFGMIYDCKKESIILHGGHGSGNQNDQPVAQRMFYSPHLSDTWVWNGSSWQLVQNKPLTLQNHALTSDKKTQQNIIQGGWNGSQRMDGTYIMSDNDWIKADEKNGVGPGVRDTHTMIFDEKRKSIILFGGSTMKLEFGKFTKAMQVAFGDTWEFAGNEWTKLQVKSPDPRWGHKMVYDEKNGVIVLIGGCDGSNYFSDTWLWEGNTATWSKIATENMPSARCSHAMTYDRVSKKVLLFGGKTQSGDPLNDLWEWDGSDWKLLMEHAPPKPRYDHGFVYDEKRNKTILFGGYDGKDYFQDTWELSFL
jgi:hypothetical protein